jgi:penicillin amidase
VVGEPDANNQKALDRMAAMGFTPGERVSYQSPQGHKVARMAYLTREAALAGGTVR